MAYQYKESKVNVELINIYIDIHNLEFLHRVSEFFHISRSKLLDFKLKGGNYEQIQNKLKKANKKVLSKQKNISKDKTKMQKREYFCECLPYFADKGVL